MTNPGLEPLRTSAQVRDELLLVEREHRRAVDTAQELSGRRKFTQADAVRKDFTPTEAVAIGRLIEEKHREKIEAVRHVANSKAGKASALKRNGISTTAIKEEHVAVGHTDVVAAKAVGMSESTYFRARAVVAAAEADPERFGDLPERMDETGNVSGTHREMKRREAADPMACRLNISIF